jgi:hypothetical protein
MAQPLTLSVNAMRRLPITLLVGLIGGLLAPSPTSFASTLAQTGSDVTIKLVSQSGWNSIDRPLELTFQATNLSATTLDQLTVELSIYAPARSRSLYELSLSSDATPLIVGYPFPETGTLDPGQTRAFHLGPQTLEVLEVRRETALYPLKIELRSQDLPVATVRSPMVFLFEHPEVPLNLAWTWVLSEPLQFRPDGTFGPGPIEADIAPGGRLESMARALVRLSTRQVDVVVSSVLVDQLQRMAKGYRIDDGTGGVRTVPAGTAGAADAAALLKQLEQIAESERTELLSTPFADPSLPALFQAGLAGDLKDLTDRGRATVAEALGREPTHDVLRPYRSLLDPATLPRLAQMDVRTVLVNSNFIPAEKFASPPVMRLSSGDSSVAAILPNPEVATLVAAAKDDPYLAAHLALGELAAIWLELPGTPARGAAMLFSEAAGIPTPFYRPFAELVRHSPWLHPINATGFVSIIPAAAIQDVPPRAYPRFPQSYVFRLRATRDSLTGFHQTADGAAATEGPLKEDLQLALSGTFVSDPSRGLPFLQAISNEIRRTYDSIGLDTSVPVTLTSQGGLIPLVLTNDSGQDFHVVLRFDADRRLEFPGGNTRDVTLAPGRRTLTIPVRARATGRIPIYVHVLSSGPVPEPVVLDPKTIVVRSTAYNRVALFVTIGAALFLLGWWGRRFLPRRRSTHPPRRSPTTAG